LNKSHVPLQQDDLYTLSPNGNAFAYMHFIPVSRRPGARQNHTREQHRNHPAALLKLLLAACSKSSLARREKKSSPMRIQHT
jgi:hypothetical protein